MLFNFFMILLLDSGRPTFGRGSAACRHGQSLPACRSSLSVTVADGFGLPDLMNRYEQATIPGRVMLIYINATQAYVFAGSAFLPTYQAAPSCFEVIRLFDFFLYGGRCGERQCVIGSRSR